MKRKLFLMGTLTLFVVGGIFWSCQKEEIFADAESTLKKAKFSTTEVEEISLTYPEEVNINVDFNIDFSSTCGKLLIERGYILDTDEVTKIYNNLDCDTDDLQWEELGSGGFSECAGGTHVQNLSEEGTYIYRTKWNPNAQNKTDCDDCTEFNGNEIECFTILAISQDCESWQEETAFGGETSLVGASPWLFYFDGNGSQTIWAGQHIDAGNVEIIDGDLVISLSNGWELQDVSDAVKVFGFSSAPEKKPNPGQNPDELLYQGDETTIEEIGTYSYYVIHLDIRKCIDND